MTNSKTPKRHGNYITGTKGVNRVRMYPHERDGMLYLEYLGEGRKKKRLSLGHADFTRGKIAANELAAALLKHEGPRSDELTLKALFDRYEVVVARGDIRKTPGKQKHDHCARALFERCWGRDTKVRDLDVMHWNAFIAQRRSGALRPAGAKKQRPVRSRMIEYDLRFLLAVMHWAELVIVRGKPLLDRNPFRGFEVPKERQPKRPQISADETASMEKAAREVGGAVELFFLIAHETGHRSNAIRQLHWSDVDFESGWINWRADADKMEAEHESPLSSRTLEQLRSARRKAGQIGEMLIFPDAEKPEQPVSRDAVIDWWLDLQRAAGLKKVTRRGWHSLRRKFANDGERAGLPLSVIAKLGGWNGTKTLSTVYIQPDRQSLRDAAERLASLRAVGE